MKFLLLNAPPRAGKNTCADIITGAKGHGQPLVDVDCLVLGLSHHLKRMTHGIYLGRAGWDLDPDAFDAVKSEPQDMLGGMSWRQAYIHYSENVIKPLHGKEWFGSMFLQTAREWTGSLVIVPDSGFKQEAERVVRDAGADNVRLVRLHRDGCTYAGDSRSYISLKDLGVIEYDVVNEMDDLNAMREAVRNILGKFMGPQFVRAPVLE